MITVPVTHLHVPWNMPEGMILYVYKSHSLAAIISLHVNPRNWSWRGQLISLAFAFSIVALSLLLKQSPKAFRAGAKNTDPCYRDCHLLSWCLGSLMAICALRAHCRTNHPK